MSLQKEINKMRQEIRTDGYPMSINEWISLYNSEKPEIDIHPEFQRFYRWTTSQKSALIESILLGIPIPPIFVSQRQDGVWDVVDGLQRLSTIYEFIGILRNENGEVLPALTLEATQYLPSLDGKKWYDPEDPDNSLTDEERLLIKRSKISASILLRESDEIAKFELFQRLNTGGSNLTPQEVRNCILVMANRDLYQWLRELSQYESFQETISLSERPLQEQYDVELVLRFIILHNIHEDDLKGMNDVGVFLTEQMLLIARNTSYNRESAKQAFYKTFDLLESTVGNNAFRRYDTIKNKFLGGFLLSPFETIACGIGYNYLNTPDKNDIERLIKSIWTNQDFTDWSRSGVAAIRRLPKILPLGREIFKG